MLNVQKQNRKQCQKFKFFNIVLETLPMSIHDFGAVNMVCTTEKVAFETVTPYGPKLTKTEQNHTK